MYAKKVWNNSHKFSSFRLFVSASIATILLFTSLTRVSYISKGKIGSLKFTKVFLRIVATTSGGNSWKA